MGQGSSSLRTSCSCLSRISRRIAWRADGGWPSGRGSPRRTPCSCGRLSWTTTRWSRMRWPTCCRSDAISREFECWHKRSLRPIAMISPTAESSTRSKTSGCRRSRTCASPRTCVPSRPMTSTSGCHRGAGTSRLHRGRETPVNTGVLATRPEWDALGEPEGGFGCTAPSMFQRVRR